MPDQTPQAKLLERAAAWAAQECIMVGPSQLNEGRRLLAGVARLAESLEEEAQPLRSLRARLIALKARLDPGSTILDPVEWAEEYLTRRSNP